jgi:hypothetical protein
MRFSKMGGAALAALVLVAVISQASLAQREPGRGGRGGRFGRDGGGFGGMVSSLRLVALEPVQTALKVTGEQKETIGKINDQVAEDFRKARDEGNVREKMQEIYASASAKLNEVLDADQQKRLMGISVQVNGANATADPAVAKELNITEDQKKQLDEVRRSNMEAMRELFDGGRDEGSREEMRAKRDKAREEGNKKLLAVLTSDQQAQLEALKGEKVDIDLSQLRGPGGRFGDRERRDRGPRDRGDRDAESKGEEKSSN